MQGITAPVSLGPVGEVTLDDSNDPNGQNVTLNTSGDTATVSGLARFATISFNEHEGFFDIPVLDEYTVKTGTGTNTINILNTFGATVDLNTGTGSATVNVKGTSAIGLDIEGQAGFDTVNIGNNGSLQGIKSDVGLNAIPSAGGSKRVALFVDGSNETSPQNVSMGADPQGRADFLIAGLIPVNIFGDPDFIQYGAAHTSLVDVKGGKGSNTYTVNDTIPTGSTQIDTGTGNDQVFVQGTSGQLFINSQGLAASNQGLTSITVGNSINANNRSLLTIHGAINITNPHSLSSLTLDGSADLVNRTVVLSATPSQGEIDGLGGGASIFYNPGALGAIHIIGGEGSEQYLIRSTAGVAPISIDGFGSAVNFIVGNSNNSLDDIHNPLTLNGGAGFDQLIVNDTGAATGHFYSNDGRQITRDFGAITIDYSGMDGVKLNRSTKPIPFIGDIGFPQATGLALTNSIRAGQHATLTGKLVDTNPDQVLSLRVNWGDGSAPVAMKPDRAPFRLRHRYEEPGTYTVPVIWRDRFGQENLEDLTLTVQPAEHHGHDGGRMTPATTRTAPTASTRSSG
jgi:hypothetical protein